MIKLNKANQIHSCQSGYTLIQMAIALLVIGVISAAFLQVYSLYERTQHMLDTQDNIQIAVNNLQKFRQANGFYPCPAPMNAARTDATYGTTFESPALTAAADGSCVNGVCIERSPRTDLTPVPRVRVGAIPFRNMQLDEGKTFDGYGSRMWYAVTEDMCYQASFSDDRGGIGIYNDRNESQTRYEGTAGFIIISPGENKVGAYNKFGTLTSPCTNSADTNNCRDVTVPGPTVSSYLIRSVMDATAATTYDDTVQYFSAAVNQLWRRTQPTSEDIVNMTDQNVGVGTITPAQRLTITQSTVELNTTDLGVMRTTNEVDGDNESGALRANDRTRAVTYCDHAGDNCFQTIDILGDPAAETGGMYPCPAGQHAVGITNAVGLVDPRYPTTLLPTSHLDYNRPEYKHAILACSEEIGVYCPDGEILSGFTTMGDGSLRPDCGAAPVVSCPAMTATPCGENTFVPGGAEGSYSQYFSPVGACAQIRYYCDGGTWVVDDWASTVPQNCTNTLQTYPAIACGDGYTGTFTGTDMTCGGAWDDTWLTDCPPTCIPYDDVVTTTCDGPNMSGGPVTTTTHYICDNGGMDHISDPSNPPTVTGTPCTCSLSQTDEFAACPSGYIRSGTAPTPPHGGSWPGPEWGLLGETTVNGDCTSSPPSSYTDYCVCDVNDQYTAQLAPVPSCQVPRTGTRTVNGTAYDYAYDVYRATVNAGTCTTGTPVLVSPAEFVAATPAWRQLPGSPISTGLPNSNGYNLVDSTSGCSCSNIEERLACALPSGGSGYDIYYCRCQ